MFALNLAFALALQGGSYRRCSGWLTSSNCTLPSLVHSAVLHAVSSAALCKALRCSRLATERLMSSPRLLASALMTSPWCFAVQLSSASHHFLPLARPTGVWRVGWREHVHLRLRAGLRHHCQPRRHSREHLTLSHSLAANIHCLGSEHNRVSIGERSSAI